VSATDPSLEPGAYDLILLSEVDQYLQDRVAYLGQLRAALAPGGRIVVTNRRTYHAPLVEAVRAAGLQVQEREVLQTHFVVEATP
jgi:hypothetical protein